MFRVINRGFVAKFQNINISLASLEEKHNTCIPPQSHFLTSGHLLRTPDNSNCFRFGSSLERVRVQESTVHDSLETCSLKLKNCSSKPFLQLSLKIFQILRLTIKSLAVHG